MNKTEALERLTKVMRRKHMAYKTERAYIGWVVRYIDYLRVERPDGDPAQKMEVFLTRLALEDKAAATQNQAFNALRFFYEQVLKVRLGNVNALRAQRPEQIRHAPTPSQTAAILDAVQDRNGYPIRLICCLLYGAGLRVSEPLNLRIKDLDIEARRLLIRGAKSGKDRVVALPESLVPQIVAQLQVARGIWERDKQNRLPVQLPNNLHRKYPAAQFSWGWAFLFPAHNPCKHPRKGHLCRYRMHEANVQRAVREAARSCGLEGVVTPHNLRHGYGTHLLERGANPRNIQAAMGHKSLETTMGYLHSESLVAGDPLIYLAAEKLRPIESRKDSRAS